MEFLRKLFPFSFIVLPKQTDVFIKSLLVYGISMIVWIVVSLIVGTLVGVLPLIGLALQLTGIAIDLYCLSGIALSILRFVDVLKD